MSDTVIIAMWCAVLVIVGTIVAVGLCRGGRDREGDR